MEDCGPMMEKPLTGVDNAMNKLECECNEVERVVANLIDRLHTVLMPEAPEPGVQGGNPNTMPSPSPVSNHLNGMAAQLTAVSSKVRRVLDRLDV